MHAVDSGFDDHEIPYDVIWLDIEHTNGKRWAEGGGGAQQQTGAACGRISVFLHPGGRGCKYIEAHQAGLSSPFMFQQ